MRARLLFRMLFRLLSPLLLCGGGALSTGAAAAMTVTILADGDVSGWEYQRSEDIPETRYRTGWDAELGEHVLFAESAGGASGWLLRRDDLDFSRTPWAHFQWRTDAAAGGFDEGRKDGDDYALRIYFVRQSGLRFRTVVLARTQQAAGSARASPYGNWLSAVVIHSAAGADAPVGAWQTGRVNMAALWRKHFGAEAALDIGAVGLMTDGDSAGVEMRARYGRILLSDAAASPFAAPPPP